MIYGAQSRWAVILAGLFMALIVIGLTGLVPDIAMQPSVHVVTGMPQFSYPIYSVQSAGADEAIVARHSPA